MSLAEAFWAALTASALVWYGSVTLYVALRGFRDLRVLLRRLSRPPQADGGEDGSGEYWQPPVDAP